MTVQEREGLPEGWVEATFGELNRYTSANVDPLQYPEEVFELYSVPNFPKGEPEYQKGADIGSTKQSVQPEDVLVCKINPRINRVWRVSARGEKRQIGSSEWIVFRAPELHADFYKQFFSSDNFRELLCADVTGVGGSLTRAQPSKVATFSVPVPPLLEQIRIANKLDTLLARVEAGRERLERVPGLLKRFRQSVLSAAVSGELTQDWRGGEDTEWEETRFEELIQEGPKNGLYKHSSAYGDGHRILRIGDFYDGEVNQQVTLKRLTLSKQELEEFEVLVGDIIINRVNSFEYLGKSAIIRSLEERTVFESNMMRVRVDRQRILPNFCILFLISQFGRDELRRNAKHAVNQASINQSDVKGSRLNLPPPPEQAEIVRRVEALFAIADRLEQRYQAALTTFNRLTPALLAKAFRGELVPQDPNDEPASVLLERIRAQRAEEGSAAKRGHKPKTSSDLSKDYAPKRRGRPPRAETEMVAAGQPKRRGRPPKVREEASAIPQASSMEEAVRLPQECGQQRAEGSRQVSLFSEDVTS